MGCCGQGRTVARRAPTARMAIRKPVSVARPPDPAMPPAPAASSGATAQLRYVKQGGIVVRGPVTGKQYAFSAATPVQQVAAQDAAGLLRTSWFRRT